MVGKPYTAITRLYSYAAAHWVDIDGDCVLRGVEPLLLPPNRFLNLLRHWFQQRVEDKDQWEQTLLVPLPTEPVRPTPTPLEAEMEAEGFAAFYAQVTGGKG